MNKFWIGFKNGLSEFIPNNIESIGEYSGIIIGFIVWLFFISFAIGSIALTIIKLR
jgi:hypothetical protein